MRRGLTGRKNEPIDVDDLYDGVEEIIVPRPNQGSPTPSHNRRQASSLGLSSQHPIPLDSDEEVNCIVAIDRPTGNSVSTNAPGHRNAIPLRPLTNGKKHLSNQLKVHDGSHLAMPLLNLRLSGLVSPALSPSPKKLPCRDGSPQQLLKQEPNERHDLPEEQVVKMDVDGVVSTVIATKKEDSSDDDSDWWEWNSPQEMDDDEAKDLVDIEAELKNVFGDETKWRRAACTASKSISFKTMMRAEMALPIPLQYEREYPKKRRIWDIPRTLTRRHLFPPLTADYRNVVRARTGILNKRTYLPEHNVFNCWLNLPLPRLNPFHRGELRASGCINKIVQSGEFIAVGSPAAGGGFNPAQNSPYNKEGNLILFQGHKCIFPSSFTVGPVVESPPQLNLHRSEETNPIKYFTVNDVAFDPLRPNRLVTSGYDGRVHVLDLELRNKMFQPRNLTYKYPKTPYDISFKPGSSLFAVSCYDGNIYLHGDDERVVLPATNWRHSRPGTCIWGKKSHNPALENIFFVSAESDLPDVSRHIAFDVEQHVGVYELDINDSGDSMALDPEGRTLALITSIGPSLSLSLFDVSRNNGKRVKGTRLHALRPDSHTNRRATLESTCAEFSPDGIFLAIARNDHCVHVYDVRFLSDRPIAELVHPPVDRPRNENEEYGVMGLHWIEGWSGGRSGSARAGIGLVTGGADDCVRLWDISRTPQNVEESLVLARTEFDIACFSIGDISKNEHRLVVGDCAGEIYIFD